jgi:exosortase E/protease (VPEID-CTERM system)
MEPPESADATSPVIVCRWYNRAAGRLAIGGLLLLAEYLVLALVFDAKYVAARGGIWTGLGWAGNIVSLIVAGVTAFLLVPRLPTVRDSTRTRVGRVNPWMFLLHALLLVSFGYVTSRTFSRQAPPGPALVWILVWTSLGATTAFTLLAAVVGNWRWLTSSFGPAASAGAGLGLLAWAGGFLTAGLWGPLSRTTFFLVAAVLKLLGYDVFIDAAALNIDLEGFAVEIAPVCSGFEGIGLYVVLMSGFLYQHRATFRFPKALVLIPIGMLIVWLGNVLRIAALMLVGARIDAGIALGSFHSKAGWVFFAAITIAIALTARKSRMFARIDHTDSSAPSENMAAPLLVPVLTWIAVGLVTSMFGGHHDPFYIARVAAAGGALWVYRRKIRQMYLPPTALSVLVGLLVGIVWIAVPYSAHMDASKENLIVTLGRAGFIGWIIVRCIGSIVVVPLCEELAFRGYLARRLMRREFWDVPFGKLSWVGILGSAVVFGAVHDRWALGIFAGFLFAWIVRRSGRLTDGVVAHAVSNALIAIWVLVSGNWQHW